MPDDDDFKQFSANYLEECQKQISEFAKNPKMLERALEPFMRMQQEYIGNNNLPMPNSSSEESSTESNDEGTLEILQKILQRVQGIRRKILPEMKDNIESINDRLSRIERHLGVDTLSNDDYDGVSESEEDES